MQLGNLEEMTLTIEFKLVEQKVFQGLSQGNQVLKEIQKEISLEDAERLMQDTQDAIEYQNQLNEILGSISADEEDDLLQELADLQLSEMPNVPESKSVLDKVVNSKDVLQEEAEEAEEAKESPTLVPA